MRRLLCVLAGAAMLTSLAVSPVSAMTFTVTTTADSGSGSLRQAILDANASLGTDTIAFNIPGPGAHTIQPITSLPTVMEPVVIDGTTQPGASCLSTLLIELDGSLASDIFTSGLDISAGSSVVRGLVINRFLLDGVRLETNGGNTVECNFIGTDVTGTAARGNLGNGVEAFHSSSNVIGGTSAGSSNVISGNGNAISLEFDDADSNIIQGNLIGTDRTGTIAVGNTGGVLISSPNNLVGGSAPGARNVISANGESGIQIGIISGTHATGNHIEGNFIGTDITGLAPLGNLADGIVISHESDNVIGGTAAGTGNVISANQLEGVDLSGSLTEHNVVEGNLIGTDETGTVDLGNGHRGVLVNFGSNNVIGGTTAAARNIISGNDFGGVLLIGDATGNVVEGNLIGTRSDGTGAISNAFGVLLEGGASGNTVGGTGGGAANVIANSVSSGVYATAGPENSILGNAIYANGGLGIDLNADGVTPNDTGDPDTGPNNLQNFPVLVSVSSSGSSTTVSGTLNSEASKQYRLEFFSNGACDPSGNGEGKSFLGSTDVTTNGSGDASFGPSFPVSLAPGDVVTATATDADGNTSEFSACQELTLPTAADLSVTKSDSPDPVLAGAVLTYTVTAKNNGPSGATGVVVTDALPAGVTYLSASPSQGSCLQNAGTVSCSLGPLVNGATATVTIQVSPQQAGQLSNQASITGNESDPNSANNTSPPVTTTVSPAADLSVTKTDSPDPVHVGQPLTYTIVVSNNGPSPAMNVSIQDQLPKNAGYGKPSTTQGTCSLKPDKRLLTCNLGTMASGSIVTVTIVIKPTAKGTITNTVSVSAASPVDPNTANNSSTASTRVMP